MDKRRLFAAASEAVSQSQHSQGWLKRERTLNMPLASPPSSGFSPSRKSARPAPRTCIAASGYSEEPGDHQEPVLRWNPTRVIENTAPPSASSVSVH